MRNKSARGAWPPDGHRYDLMKDAQKAFLCEKYNLNGAIDTEQPRIAQHQAGWNVWYKERGRIRM